MDKEKLLDLLKVEVNSLKKVEMLTLLLTFVTPVVALAFVFLTNYPVTLTTFTMILVVMFVFAMCFTAVFGFSTGLQKAIRVIQNLAAEEKVV